MPPAHTNPPAAGEAEIVVEKLVYGGDGLGRADGRVVLTPFTLPGERVRVRLEREKSDLARGRLLEILDPSPVRAPPLCPHFTRCGGCHYQHAPYEYELAQKESILRETLQRVGRLEPPGRIEVVAGPEFEYRNRAQFHLDRRRIGFLSAASHTLCPVEACPVSSPRLNQALAELGAMAGDRRFPPFLRSLELFTNEAQVQLQVRAADRGVARPFFDWCAARIAGATTGPIDYPAAGERFRVSPRSFFQANRFLADRLVETALQDAAGGAALELYAGAGLFTLPLARRFHRVTAVESGWSAARDLEFNAARAELGVTVRRAAVEEHLAASGDRPDFVLADPPRAGLGSPVVRRLLDLRPPSLVLVSCDPATLARDLAALVHGGYRLDRLTMIDLFPRTSHLEAVAALVPA
jgi:23S rRNA (uracil1939-C5)-methyltransferase